MQIAQVLAGYTPRQRRSAAPRDGQEDPGRDGRAAPAVYRGRVARGVERARAEHDLRPDGEVRRLRLQQVACRRLCAGRLSDRLSEGQLPGRVPRRADDPRSRQHRQAQPLPPGVEPARHPAAAARHQPLRVVESSFHRRAGTGREGKPAIRYALAAVKGVGAQAMARAGAERDENGRFKDLFDFARRLDAKSFNRAAIREPDQGRRLRLPEPEPGADLCRGRAAAAPGEPRRPSAQDGQGSLFGARPRAPRRHCRWSRIGRRSRDCSTSSRRSASTCRAIRSTPTARASSAPASCARPTCRRLWRPAGRPGSSSPASSSARRSAPRRAATALPLCRCRTRAASSR